MPSRPRALAHGIALAVSTALMSSASAAPHETAGGGVIVVQNCDDDGTGSLREAVRDLAVSGDTIDLRFLSCGRITLTTGAIATSLADLHLVGLGSYRSTISAHYDSAVITHGGSGTLTLEGLTLQDGVKYSADATARGGCVFSLGDVVLSNSVVRNCLVQGTSAAGGGVYASGDITMFDSAVGANVARAGSGAAQGGGAMAGGTIAAKYSSFISNDAKAEDGPGWGECGGAVAANVSLIGATVFNNRADYFGGVCANDAASATPFHVRNTTVSTNQSVGGAPSAGGTGLRAAGTLELYNSTVAYNYQASAVSCAGVSVGVSAEIESSLIAGNVSGYGGSGVAINDLCGDSGATIGGSHNLIGVSMIAVPPDTLSADPRIGLLSPVDVPGDGPARWVHALLADSPAIDAGSNPLALTFDQRGAPNARVVGAAADIGAYELDPDRIFHDGFD